MDIDKILLEQENSYEKIKAFLKKYNEENYHKILSVISKFTEEDRKTICKKIINSSDNEDMIDRTCMEIDTFIKYDYEYYKEIVEIISKKKIDSTWVNEIEEKLIENSKGTITSVFEDFSIEIPQNVNYDIAIITRLLEIYDERYIKGVIIEKKQVINLCKRLNYIMTTNLINVLKIFYYFSIEYKLELNEYKVFLDEFLFNFPSICKKFIENEENYDKESDFIKYIKDKMIKHDKEENVKYNMKIFCPDMRRITEYRKKQIKQNKEINKIARKKSMLMSLFKSNTILYGKKYGITVMKEDKEKVSVGNLHEFKYEYPYPLEYLLDPVEYMEKINSLKKLERRK